jgi:predicted oxidoreductase
MFWSLLAGGKLFSRDDENIVLATGNIDRVSAATQSQLLTMNPEQWYRIWQSLTGHSVP